VYLVAKGYLTAPVTAGDERCVEVVDRGSEGDGIARVDGFTVFVPDTEVGERVDVRIDDVKPRFAFAERLD
jgi:23S rRNA (uridine2552-2'-O)-methyltransferase